MLLLLKSNTAGALAASVGITLTVAATLTVTPASGAALAASLPVTINTVAALNATSSSLTAGLPITVAVVANLTIRPPATLLSTLAVRVTTAADLTIAPAPAGNLTSGTAIAITLPYATTQDVNIAGLTKTVWYKYVAPVDGLVSIWAFGDLVTYKPKLTVFSPDAVTFFPTGDAINRPLQFWGVTGVTYYFKIVSSTGNVTPAVLTLTAQLFANGTAPAGSIAVNDDFVGLPLALLSSTDAAPLRFVSPFPSGESADVLANGILAVEDKSGQATDGFVRIALYDGTLASIATVTIDMPVSGWQLSYLNSNKTSRFYVGLSSDYDLSPVDGFSSFFTISPAGVASARTLLGNDGLSALAPNNAETILYWSREFGAPGSLAVKRWDLINGVALTDLAADIGGGYAPSEIRVLADGRVVVLYGKHATFSSKILVYSSAGALLQTFDYGINLRDTRLASDPSDTSFWLWTKLIDDPVSTFRHINPDDGSVLHTATAYLFEDGVYDGLPTATPPSLFGHSESCPFWVTRVAVSGPAPPAGTLIVRKVTDPADPTAEFTFTVDGGLSPATFTLKNGESRTFADITPGTYVVTETAQPATWVFGSAVVDNGDPSTAIGVGDGETVTILFSNIGPGGEGYPCAPATERIACWNGFTGAELQIRRVAE